MLNRDGLLGSVGTLQLSAASLDTSSTAWSPAAAT
ncbi:hypothetical protein [Pseudomonas bharatica]